MVKSALKKLIGRFVSSHELYYIYKWHASAASPNVTTEAYQLPDEPSALSREWFKNEAFYAGEGSIGFALDTKTFSKAAICWYWYGSRYEQDSGFWHLKPRDALLMMIRTHESCYGQGLATKLIQATSICVTAKGFDRLFARIWWSNKPSLLAFRRAGWSPVAFVVTINFAFMRRRSRIVLPLSLARE
jgi:GNAT superfamily N-acetyltransferase